MLNFVSTYKHVLCAPKELVIKYDSLISQSNIMDPYFHDFMFMGDEEITCTLFGMW